MDSTAHTENYTGLNRDNIRDMQTTLQTVYASTSGLSNGTSYNFDNNYILLSAYCFFGLTVVVSNVIVVTVVVKSQNLHKPTLWNIAFMATCDLLYGLHYIVFSVPSLFLGKFAYSEKLITMASVSMTFLFGQNVLNIYLTLVDRFIAIIWPLRYPMLMSANRFFVAVLVMVAINIGRLCFIIFPNSVMYYSADLGICLVNFNTIPAGTASVGLPFLITILNVILLVIIGIKLKSRKKMHPQVSSNQGDMFTVTMSLAALVFILCYLPTCTAIVVNVVYGLNRVSLIHVRAALVFLLSNSFWNVVIYATTFRPFRESFLRLFCKKYFRDQLRREVVEAHSVPLPPAS